MKRVNWEKNVLTTFCPTVLQLLSNLAREVLLAFGREKEKKNIQALIKKVYSPKKLKGILINRRCLDFSENHSLPKAPNYAISSQTSVETDKSSKLPTIIMFGLLS